MSGRSRFTCEEMFRRLDDYLDHELTPEEMRKAEAHLAECAQCASEHRFERGVLDAVRSKVQRLQVPPDLASNVFRRLADAVGERADDPPAGAGPPAA
jgi:anti-sigma factor (TIGR02949 family)